MTFFESQEQCFSISGPNRPLRVEGPRDPCFSVWPREGRRVQRTRCNCMQIPTQPRAHNESEVVAVGIVTARTNPQDDASDTCASFLVRRPCAECTRWDRTIERLIIRCQSRDNGETFVGTFYES